MHQPPLFYEDRVEVMQALMRAHPFATFVTCANGVPTADHIPFVLASEATALGVLRGHLGAGNPLAQARVDPSDALVIFQGPQSYITPSWYASKTQHGKVVPTWNYVVVHARGTFRLIRDKAWLLDHLEELTRQHEQNRDQPWAVNDAPGDFIRRQLRGLVGVEINVTELEGIWKVSQNKTVDDAGGVVRGLRAADGPDKTAVAALVEVRRRRVSSSTKHKVEPNAPEDC